MDNTKYQVSQLIKLTVKDRLSAADVLARAFRDYEVLRYYYPDEQAREAIAHTFCFIAVSVCFKYGEVYTSSTNMEGVSAWLPPGKAPFGVWQLMNSVPFSTLLRFGRQGAKRMQAFGRYTDNLHRKLVPYPHWYLQMLGVDPEYQGQGYSRRLVSPILERTDREKLPCYLETNNRKNVSIYQQFGFKLIAEDIAPGTDLYNFAMLKKP